MVKNNLSFFSEEPTQDNIEGGGLFAIRGDLDGELAEDFVEKLQFIGLLINSEEFLMPISAVNEIVMLKPITFVPNAATFVEGVFNLRGSIIPAINLRKMMGVAKGEATMASRLIIVKHGEIVVGLLVDGITYVVSLLPTQMEQRTLTGSSQGAELINKISKFDDRVIGILDLSKIISTAADGKIDLLVDEKVAEQAAAVEL